jgi:hypothetical protein
VPEIFDLLSHSERVLADLARGGTEFALALRQWEPRLQFHLEFRSFVCQNRLTAISQCENRAFYPDINENKGLILNAIRSCFEEKIRPAFECKGIFPNDSYVADFAILLSKRDRRVNGAEAILVEINRFNQDAGAFLFHWTEDFEVLTGVRPFEFRMASPEQFADWDCSQAWALEDFTRGIKSDIFQSRKSWFEKWLSWWKKGRQTEETIV